MTMQVEVLFLTTPARFSCYAFKRRPLGVSERASFSPLPFFFCHDKHQMDLVHQRRCEHGGYIYISRTTRAFEVVYLTQALYLHLSLSLSPRALFFFLPLFVLFLRLRFILCV